MDKELAKQNLNTKIDATFVIGKGKISTVLAVPTMKVDNDRRGRPKTVLASYCPFCGTKYPE